MKCWMLTMMAVFFPFHVLAIDKTEPRFDTKNSGTLKQLRVDILGAATEENIQETYEGKTLDESICKLTVRNNRLGLHFILTRAEKDRLPHFVDFFVSKSSLESANFNSSAETEFSKPAHQKLKMSQVHVSEDEQGKRYQFQRIITGFRLADKAPAEITYVSIANIDQKDLTTKGTKPISYECSFY